MDRINRILILFFTILAFSLGGVIHIIQTEKFASILSQKIKKKIKKEFNAEITFRKIEVKLFPPASILKGVEVVTEKSGTKIELLGEEVGLYFSFFDFFSRKFQIDTVKMNAFDLLIESKDIIDSTKLLNYTEVFKIYIDTFENAPVRIKNFEFSNFEINHNSSSFGFSHLNLSLFKGLVLASGRLTDLQMDSLPETIKNIEIDSLEFTFHLRGAGLDIKKLSLFSGLDKLKIDGNINTVSEDPKISVNANLQAGLRSLSNKVGLGKIVENYSYDGVSELNLIIGGSFGRPTFNMEGEVSLLESEFARADKINFSLEQKENELWLNTLKISKDESEVKLLHPLALINLGSNQILSNEVFVSVSKLHTNDALYALRTHLDVLKGTLGGNVRIGYNKKGIYFIPEEGFELKGLKLFNPSYERIILQNKGFKILKSNLFLTYDLSFKFQADLKLENSKLSGEGRFNAKEMNVSIFKSLVDLEDIGPIVGLNIFGRGTISGSIFGSYDDVRFKFLPDLDKFSVLDFNLGRIAGRVDFDLKKLELDIKNVQSVFNGTRFEGGSLFEFEKDKFSLDIRVSKGTYSDAVEMIPTLIAKIQKQPLDVDFNFKGNLKYRSDFNIENLYVNANIESENINAFGERLDGLRGNLKVENNNLTVNNLLLSKAQGSASANGKIDLKSTKFSYKGNLSGVSLRDFDIYNTLNLGLNGKIRGEFYGEGKLENFTSRAQFRLENSEISNRAIADSIFTIYNKGSDVFVSANLFEGISITEGYLSIDKKNAKKSYLNSRLFTSDPSLLAGILSEHNYVNRTLNGNIDIRSDFSFFVFDIEKFDLDFVVSELKLQYQGETIEINKRKNKLYVKNGDMENWNLHIKTSEGGFFESTAKGNVSKSFQLSSKFKFNPVFLRMVSPKLLSAVGEVEGSSVLLREKSEFSLHSEMYGRDIDLKIENIPGALRHINFKLISEGQEVLLEKFTGEYGQGDIKAEGNIFFKLPFPEVNLRGSVSGSQVSITDKTYVVVSGTANLAGKKLPYVLKGGVSVLHGEVFNEFEDFSKMMGLSEGYLRYIPNAGKIFRKDILNYDLDFDIFNPVQVKNSISDLKLDGSLKIRGSMSKPLVTGDINILPNVSRIFFKGNEFILSEGRLSFIDFNKKEVPEIKLSGLASVDRYEVGLSVDGRVDKFGIKLTSSPSLDQGQILSLLVLGVPDDINQELDDSDREQIAVQGGVGLIVERFKLVKPIDSMLGLKFSVSPEFQESDSSLLEGRLSSGEAGASRYKSGTKIKVQKKILKKVDVSFSSTVGGTVEETKEMNVNYNIDKNLSLEGVYELRSVEEETEENPESVGADIKWKFSF